MAVARSNCSRMGVERRSNRSRIVLVTTALKTHARDPAASYRVRCRRAAIVIASRVVGSVGHVSACRNVDCLVSSAANGRFFLGPKSGPR